MKLKIVLLGLILSTIAPSNQLIPRQKKYIFDENTYDCGDENEIKLFVLDLDVIAESEYDMYLNGSLTFLADIKAPWRIEAYGKKLEQGEWYRKIERKVDDFCFSKNNPADIFHPLFRKFKDCPLKKGVRKMLKFSDGI